MLYDTLDDVRRIARQSCRLGEFELYRQLDYGRYRIENGKGSAGYHQAMLSCGYEIIGRIENGVVKPLGSEAAA